MIGGRIIKGKTQELFEGGSIIDLGFQFRVRVDVKPLLEEQAFHQEYRRISFVSPGGFTDGIGFVQSSRKVKSQVPVNVEAMRRATHFV